MRVKFRIENRNYREDLGEPREDFFVQQPQNILRIVLFVRTIQIGNILVIYYILYLFFFFYGLVTDRSGPFAEKFCLPIFDLTDLMASFRWEFILLPLEFSGLMFAIYVLLS